MKVYMKKNITAYSGIDKEEHVVYNSMNEGNVCYARSTFEFNPNAHTEVFRSQMENLQALWAEVTGAYKAQLKLYEVKRRNLFPNNVISKTSNYGLFVKQVFAYAKAESADVATVDIIALRASALKSVSEAVTADYLPKVDSYELYSATM